ncbi:MAG TPA: hypothetical protein VNH43_01695 [Vicinamibacteria bacterium]|nr:hypothetical protein [Vicinamibacteria bacterium]
MRLLVAVAAVVLAVAAPTWAAAPQSAVTRWGGGDWTVWRIDRLPADRGLTEYADIRLRAGDAVTLDAGGCISRTLVWLPGTAAPVPLAGALRRQTIIPASAGNDSRALRLGFAGARRECAGQPEGYVFVAVKRAEVVEVTPAPVDLVWEGTDVNAVALNPKWGLQVTNPGTLPDVGQICFSVPDYFENPLCSTQHPGIDTPSGLRRLICSIGTKSPIAGHVNWYPGTFEGPLYWDSLSFADRDNNVRLIPLEQNALTAQNPENIKGEFDSRETTNHFATPWWTSFRKAGTPGRKSLIDGKPSILYGFTSVDCEHHCVSELHPVWVLAIHVQDDPADDVWAVFMRNWGNEGFCSSAQHEVNWPGERFTLTLPWRVGAAAVELEGTTQFLANVEGISGRWADVPNEKVTLTFALPPPSDRARVHGELHLRWNGPTVGAGGGDGAPAAPSAWDEQGGEAEALVEDLLARLPPEKRQALDPQLGPSKSLLDAVPVVLQHGPVEEAGAPVVPPSVTSRPDPGRTAEDERRLRALLAAFRGRVPGPIGVALDREPEKP